MDIMGYAQNVAASIIAQQQTFSKKTELVATKIEAEKPVQFYNISLEVNDVITEIYKQTDYLPWTSFDLTNIGPNPVFFCVNEWLSPEAPLPVGQSINVDFKKKDSIKKVYLKCDKGQKAKVSFYIMK